MTRSLLADAFDHHVWATLRLIDACAALTPEQLEAGFPGLYGSILDTLRHTVAADCGYLFVLSGGSRPRVDDEGLSLDDLRSEMEANGPAWTEVLDNDLDPDDIAVRHHDDGSSVHAPKGIRLAQAIHHGTDHRSQICTALTQLGIEPPEIDVWAYGHSDRRVIETPAGA